MLINCTFCGKEFYKRPSEVKKDKRHFCCLDCRKKYFENKKIEKEKGRRHKCDFKNKFIQNGEVSIMLIESKTYGLKEVLVDTNKIEILAKTFWHVAKMYDGYFSVIGWIKDLGKEMPIHRYLTNCPNNKEVDHINRNPLDNRLSNLRCVDRSKNMLNKQVQPNSKLGIKGVRKRENGTFQARIMINKKAISIGHFKTLEEAVQARKEYCLKFKIIS